MDIQGTPLPHGHHSTKVTTDPRAQQEPIREPSGPITNDSLAAESIRQGGAFSSNRGAEPMGVSSEQSTVNNTDTSASIKLPSAPTACHRQDRHIEQKYPENMCGQGNFPGTHLSNSGYSGGSTAAKKEMGISTGEYSTASGSGRSQYSAGLAPSNANDMAGDNQHSTPGGRGVEEAGFPSDDAKNASFASEIGSDQDPGREALNQFQRSNAHSAYDSSRPQQKGLSTETPYGHLENDQRA
ncbi:hypothetical protein N7457_000332 [Penicillium paradoxum]|uniref:uncharacterized protein n=1 Tax=Penicillium paradoxum TaxID=176176 RepID=UPI0025479958|nr:uncharacterized protein N7457_000332 [Penicillium paradoxum]KAJ5793733.1 hypothetical protein N7457_000332 [Penicillium paradoxum]